jgi:hypothetical protein
MDRDTEAAHPLLIDMLRETGWIRIPPRSGSALARR